MQFVIRVRQNGAEDPAAAAAEAMAAAAPMRRRRCRVEDAAAAALAAAEAAAAVNAPAINADELGAHSADLVRAAASLEAAVADLGPEARRRRRT